MDIFRTETPFWDVLLDLDALAAAEGEDWVWGGATTLLPAHDRAMIRLSSGGSDACVIREFGLTRKAFIDDGFHLPEAKGHVEWLDVNTLLLNSAFGGETARTRSGYARTIRLWRRKSDPAEAPVLFEVPEENLAAGATVDRTGRIERVWYTNQLSFFEGENWIGDRNGPEQKLDLPPDAWVGFHRRLVRREDTLAMDGGRRHLRARHGAGRGASGSALGRTGGRSPVRAGRPRGPAALSSGAAAGWCCPILDNLKPRYDVLLPSATGWKRTQLAGLPDTGVVSAWCLDIEEAEWQWRPARRCAGPVDAIHAEPRRAGSRADRAEKRARGLRCRRARRHAARGCLGRWRAHSLCSDRPRRRDRRGAGANERLWRLRPRGSRTTTAPSASCGWSAAAPTSSPTSAAAASSARAGTMPAAGRASA